MNKKLVIFVLLFCSYVFAAETQSYNPNRPEWNEFCPFGMENVTMDTSRHISGTNAAWKAEEQNYWVQRKQDFEQSLSFCDNVEKISQEACYQKLRNRQSQINSTHVSPQEKYAQRQAQWAQFNNFLNQQNQQIYQRKQLELQRTNMLLQNAPKYSDIAPKTYNVNIEHNTRHYGF